ncbi:hypothetical protein FIBSPDRAFT_902778 [Athelia psychrophila]|uniref:Uncharacterized protein n=1 Tax=Athelia psychrophila TaxID=1759441 RepID=A0A167WTN9_9AGAM|nr:hypothetical protein FIBSPDRAFT_902778 [Fibularhizoctonia sp. CBS 109695]
MAPQLLLTVVMRFTQAVGPASQGHPSRSTASELQLTAEGACDARGEGDHMHGALPLEWPYIGQSGPVPRDGQPCPRQAACAGGEEGRGPYLDAAYPSKLKRVFWAYGIQWLWVRMAVWSSTAPTGIAYGTYLRAPQAYRRSTNPLINSEQE